MAAPNPQRQRQERDRLARLFANPQSVCIVHYGCQNFSRLQQSPRIACIALRNLESGVTVSFSIHRELELAKSQMTLDELERGMLDKYFSFLGQHKGMTFLHWNMRDIKFGFAAIEHRYEVLGGTPYQLPDHQKIDVSILFTNLYGANYLPKPTFEYLAKRNELSLAGYLAGNLEPELFDQGEYYAVLQSTLCKVTIIAEAVKLACDGTLRTDATWWTLNVGRVREAWELFENNPVKAWGGLLATVAMASFSIFAKLF